MLRLSVSCDFENPGAARDFLFAACQEINRGHKSGLGWLLSEPGELSDEEEKVEEDEPESGFEAVVPHVDVIQENHPGPRTPDGAGDAPMPWEKNNK